eukprot:2920531-Amphidinium_carterae.1
MLCDDARIRDSCLNAKKRSQLIHAVRQCVDEKRQDALERIPPNYRPYFDKMMKVGKWRCEGRDGEPCVFASSAQGGSVQVHQKSRRCMFCDPDLLDRTLATQRGKQEVRNALMGMGLRVRKKAVDERIPEAYKTHFKDTL